MRGLLALALTAACADKGPWVLITVHDVPASPIMLRAEVTLGTLSATQVLADVSG